jgi:hypothetical protein
MELQIVPFWTDYSTETVSGCFEGMNQRNWDMRVFHMDYFVRMVSCLD